MNTLKAEAALNLFVEKYFKVALLLLASPGTVIVLFQETRTCPRKKTKHKNKKLFANHMNARARGANLV